jgi:diacylglycerol kinase family enzyme
VIYNPEAGQLRRHPELLDKAIAAFAAKWPAVERVATDGPMRAGVLAAECVAAGSSLILVAGGDGTVNEALAGVSGSSTPFGVLPFGTANVLANELRLGNNPVRAARRLEACVPLPVSLGRMSTISGTRLFLCMAGVGLDARVVRRIQPEVKRQFGKFAYWIGAFGEIGTRLPEFTVRVNGREYRSSFALISRVRNYGGDLEIARKANLLDDHFAVVLFEGAGTLRYIPYFLSVLTDTMERMPGVRVLDAANVEIETPDGAPVDLQLDGEHAGYAPARFDLVEGAIRLLIPPPFLTVMSPAIARLQPSPL